MAASKGSSRERTFEQDLQLKQLTRDKWRDGFEVLKWVAVAIGAVVSFRVIDVGRLELEQFQARAQNERELLTAYLSATEATEPQIWRRKLQILAAFSTDENTKGWATTQLAYVDNFAGLEALYLETLKTASQLADPAQLQEPARKLARARYEQLYWADLPFFGEHNAVASAMVAFRKVLTAAEDFEAQVAVARSAAQHFETEGAAATTEPEKEHYRTQRAIMALATTEAQAKAKDGWNAVAGSLLDLSEALKSCTKKLRTTKGEHNPTEAC
jgi:hypothetical protein